MNRYEELRGRHMVLELFAKVIREEVFPLIPNYEDSSTFEELRAYRRFFKGNLAGLWYGAGGPPMWDIFKFTLDEVKQYPLEIAYLISVKAKYDTALQQVLIYPQDDLEEALAVYNQYPIVKEEIIIYKKEKSEYSYSSYDDEASKIFYAAYCNDCK